TVATGAYEFAPAHERTVRIGGKARVMYAVRPTDRIVHGVVADLLESAAPSEPQGVSYQGGLSWWARRSRRAGDGGRHWRAHPDPRTRGLYVIRRDIDSYTDSIPVGDRSPLWPQVRALLERAQGGAPVVRQDWRNIEQVIRIEAVRAIGGPFTLFCGGATGPPGAVVPFHPFLKRLGPRLPPGDRGLFRGVSPRLLFAPYSAGG